MIILDTCILRSFSPQSSSADLLRAIRALNAEQVAVPWMVLEELVAQQAVKYREKYEVAARAVEALRQAAAGPLEVPLGSCDLDAVRAHWRTMWREVVGDVRTSDAALREALFREANVLAPCRNVKGFKTGARDAAIWLSAVEYAREHPDTIVYFVSANTEDFGGGAPYPSPMSEDLNGLEGRFKHLISMEQVAARFAEPTATNEALAASILGSEDVLAAVVMASGGTHVIPHDGSFSCTVSTGLAGEYMVVPALSWWATTAVFDEVDSMQTYRIGDQEWCTAVVRWNLGGSVITDTSASGSAWGGCSWTTSVLFTPTATNSRLTVLRDQTPLPLSDEAFEALGMPSSAPTKLERMVHATLRASTFDGESAYGRLQRLPRTYEGALVRQARAAYHEYEGPADE
ncbi:PIN domain-containing protein [Streptomyces sp. Tue6028]|uniref:PIN domain-containing protein n=1 Tax=Streptomyces sp. Tue6028 TaxID=2036037 RepID=UPI003D73A26D